MLIYEVVMNKYFLRILFFAAALPLYGMESNEQEAQSLSYLSQIILNDDAQGLQELIDQGLPLHENIVPDPVELAAMNNCPNVLAVLLEAGANFQRENVTGALPLELTLMLGNFEAARLLLTATFKKCKQDQAILLFSKTLEKLLVLEREVEIDFLLTEIRQWLSSELIIQVLNTYNNYPTGLPLEIAIHGKNVEQIKILLKHGAQFKYCFSTGRTTALIMAVMQKDFAMVKFMLASGLNPNESDVDNNTPLITAIHEKQPEIVKLLLDYGANVNCMFEFNDIRYSPLGLAIVKEAQDIVRLLLHAGADWSTYCSFGALHGTCFDLCNVTAQRSILTQLLLRQMLKAAVDRGDSLMIHKITRFFMPKSSEHNNIKRAVQEFLYQNRFFLHQIGLSVDFDALVGVVIANDVPAILSKGDVRLAAKSRIGSTTVFQYQNMAIPLISKFENGDTLLHAAVRGNKLDKVRLLLSCGASPLGINNNDRETPYALAIRLNNKAIMRELALAL